MERPVSIFDWQTFAQSFPGCFVVRSHLNLILREIGTVGPEGSRGVQSGPEWSRGVQSGRRIPTIWTVQVRRAEEPAFLWFQVVSIDPNLRFLVRSSKSVVPSLQLVYSLQLQVYGFQSVIPSLWSQICCFQFLIQAYGSYQKLPSQLLVGSQSVNPSSQCVAPTTMQYTPSFPVGIRLQIGRKSFDSKLLNNTGDPHAIH